MRSPLFLAQLIAIALAIVALPPHDVIRQHAVALSATADETDLPEQLHTAANDVERLIAERDELIAERDELIGIVDQQRATLRLLGEHIQDLTERIAELEQRIAELEADPPGRTRVRLWLWADPPPDSTLGELPEVEVCIRVNCRQWWHPAMSEPRSPERVAELVIEQIEARGLDGPAGRGRIAVILQSFADDRPEAPEDELPSMGRGPRLFFHPGDAVEAEGLDWTAGLHTPWTSAGVSHWRGWLERFVAAWKERAPGIVPARFFFDEEPPVMGEPRLTLDVVLGAESNAWSAAFIAMQADPRWNAEPLAGFPPGTTMADLWRHARQWSIDPDVVIWKRPRNRPMFEWYAPIVRQAFSGAMREVVAVLEEAWPGCIATNWEGPHSPALYSAVEFKLAEIEPQVRGGKVVIIPWLRIDDPATGALAFDAGVPEAIGWFNHHHPPAPQLFDEWGPIAAEPSEEASDD